MTKIEPGNDKPQIMHLTPQQIDRINSAIQQLMGDGVRLVVVFGSCASGKARPDSDLDIAVDAGAAMTPMHCMALIAALAEITGRPVDLVDLRTVGEPLLGQILQNGKRIHGSDTALGQYLSKHLFDMADFVPLQQRILKERRQAWIGL